MTSIKLVIQSHFLSWKNSFSDIDRKYILPNKIRAGTALIISSKMHFLPISCNVLYSQVIKRDGKTSFMDFMIVIDVA